MPPYTSKPQPVAIEDILPGRPRCDDKWHEARSGHVWHRRYRRLAQRERRVRRLVAPLTSMQLGLLGYIEKLEERMHGLREVLQHHVGAPELRQQQVERLTDRLLTTWTYPPEFPELLAKLISEAVERGIYLANEHALLPIHPRHRANAEDAITVIKAQPKPKRKRKGKQLDLPMAKP